MMLKVLYLIDAQGGGAMTHVLDLAEGIAKEEFLPEILFFTNGPAIEEANKRNIPVHLILKKGIGLVFLYRLYKFLKNNRYDILHTHTINANFFGRIAGKLSNVPTILTTIHSHVIDELKGLKKPSSGDWLRYRVDLFFSCWAKMIFVVSESIHKRLFDYGIPERKLHVVENGVDINKYRPDVKIKHDIRMELGIDENADVVGIIGRMVPLKNHDIFLKAALEICKIRKDVYFLLVGDGPLNDRLHQDVLKLGLEKRIYFTGWRTDIDRVIQSINVFVLCSEVEGHNIALLEAMACEKPVVGTDVAGIKTIIKHGETGILIPLRDIKALADAVLSLLSDTDKAGAIGRMGMMTVKNKYSLDSMITNYLELYRRAAAS